VVAIGGRWSGNGHATKIRETEIMTMAGTLTVRITESAGEIHDLRYRFIWSAWASGELLGKGHAFKPEEAIERAQDLVDDPEAVEHITIDYRGQDCFDPCR
jgi:hypothetical protein